jgi:hypothetical protein
MRIVAAEYVSADGRMQMEDPEGLEEERGGWTAALLERRIGAAAARAAVCERRALGAGHVRQLRRSWPSFTDEEGFAERMNSLPKYVASRTLKEPLEWNASLLEGDAIEAVRSLKQESGRDLLIYGNGQLFMGACAA